MNRAIILFFLLETVFTVAPSAGQHSSASFVTATVDPTKTWNTWDGWGNSLAWWARAIGGTRNAGIYADSYIRPATFPWQRKNIRDWVSTLRGGGGIKEPLERKSTQMPWSGVTRKITRAVAAILAGREDSLDLGNRRLPLTNRGYNPRLSARYLPFSMSCLRSESLLLKLD